MHVLLLTVGPFVLSYLVVIDQEKTWKTFSIRTLCYICHVLPLTLLVPFFIALYLPLNTMGITHVIVVFVREIAAPLLTTYLATAWVMRVLTPFRSQTDPAKIKQFLYLQFLFLVIYNIGRLLFMQNLERAVYVGAIAPFFSIAIPFITIIILECIAIKSKNNRSLSSGVPSRWSFFRESTAARSESPVIQTIRTTLQMFRYKKFIHQVLLLITYGVFVVFITMLFYQYQYILFGLFTVVFVGCIYGFHKLGTFTTITTLFS